MTITMEHAAAFRQTFDRMAATINAAILGKDHVVRLALTCLVAQGHLLLEDMPGTGKTSLAKALARTVMSSHSRIQFTPDLLPSDVTGLQVFNQRTQEFDFHSGPIFHNIVLADEINRASPKTQSALLEPMEEGHVTIDGVQYGLQKPFMVIATQNPVEQAGTYALPEAQLDRFLMRTGLGYPEHENMVALLRDAGQRDRTGDITPAIAGDQIRHLSDMADRVTVRTEILGYVSRLAERSREHKNVKLGLSTRGCLAYVRCAKVWALSQGRPYVKADDIRQLARPVMEHRMKLTSDAVLNKVTVDTVLREIFQQEPTPVDREM